jgi:hypothetical protein
MEFRKCRASPAWRENETMSDFGGEVLRVVVCLLSCGSGGGVSLLVRASYPTCSAIYDVKGLSLETDSVDWKRRISRIDAISRAIF